MISMVKMFGSLLVRSGSWNIGKNQILITVCSYWGYNCGSIVTFVLMLLFVVNGTLGQDFHSV
jgi:uncharacterized membrane protein